MSVYITDCEVRMWASLKVNIGLTTETQISLSSFFSCLLLLQFFSPAVYSPIDPVNVSAPGDFTESYYHHAYSLCIYSQGHGLEKSLKQGCRFLLSSDLDLYLQLSDSGRWPGKMATPGFPVGDRPQNKLIVSINA